MTKALLATLLLANAALAGERLTNEDILRLTRAGLSPTLIITTITLSEQAFDTSTSALITLRTAGVANEVLLAMLTATTPSTTAGAAPDPTQARFEFTAVLYRLTTMRSVSGILRGYDRLTYEPNKEAWREHALTLPWSSITGMCYEEGPVRGDLFLTVTDRAERIRLSTDPDKIEPLRQHITDITTRPVAECE